MAIPGMARSVLIKVFRLTWLSFFGAKSGFIGHESNRKLAQLRQQQINFGFVDP